MSLTKKEDVCVGIARRSVVQIGRPCNYFGLLSFIILYRNVFRR